MGQIPAYILGLFVLLLTVTVFLLMGAQFGGEKAQYDLVRRHIVDLVDKEGAVTPEVLDKIEELTLTNGLEFDRFSFVGSDVTPVSFFETARVEMSYYTKVVNNAADRFEIELTPLYHDVFYVKRTGR